ncbi:MAG: glutamyl-tRNA reductase [Magnetococcales bacterium]|nr:glutamyl-tRNA reductase [Magnetococcales bacterium]
MKLIVVGLNHKTTPLALRERLAFASEEMTAALTQLLAQEGIQEALLLSTCNRVEIYAVCNSPDHGVATVSQWLANSRQIELDTLLPHLYNHVETAALFHGMRVSASLDSLVVGEAQILGQLKQAYREAIDCGAAKTVLNKFFELAFQVTKRIRTETNIARHPVSIASVAVTLARKIFGKLEGHTCLLLGAGEMCELAARHLASHGVTILVANRTLARAQTLAANFQGEAFSLDQLPHILARADIILSSTDAATYLVSANMVHTALKQRRQRPQFYIDIAVPRDLDPKISDVDNAFLYDIDDLSKIVSNNQKDRGQEMAAAEAMIHQAIPTFNQWLETLEVVPTLVALRQKMEYLRDQEVAKAAAGWPDLTPDEQKRLESLGRLLVNKMLHAPLSQLRQLAAEPDGTLYVDAARKLFELE